SPLPAPLCAQLQPGVAPPSATSEKATTNDPSHDFIRSSFLFLWRAAPSTSMKRARATDRRSVHYMPGIAAKSTIYRTLGACSTSQKLRGEGVQQPRKFDKVARCR